jgi:hypothetical protein
MHLQMEDSSGSLRPTGTRNARVIKLLETLSVIAIHTLISILNDLEFVSAEDHCVVIKSINAEDTHLGT